MNYRDIRSDFYFSTKLSFTINSLLLSYWPQIGRACGYSARQVLNICVCHGHELNELLHHLYSVEGVEGLKKFHRVLGSLSGDEKFVLARQQAFQLIAQSPCNEMFGLDPFRAVGSLAPMSIIQSP